MRIGQVYPSKYLKAGDLDGPTRSQIGTVTVESFGEKGKEIPKYVAVVAGFKKQLIVNTTNSRVLETLTGSDESDDWTGTDVLLVPVKISMGGKIVDSIRIEAAPRTRKPKGGVATPPPEDDAPPPDDFGPAFDEEGA